MTTHEKLKYIIDTIMYILPYYVGEGDIEYDNKEFLKITSFTDNSKTFIKIDIREIIFTSEFMEKYLDYLKKNTTGYSSPEAFCELVILELFSHLDEPVDYIYEIINKIESKNILKK